MSQRFLRLSAALLTLFVLTAPATPSAAQESGPRTMEAFRLPADVELRIDGRLDEEVWQQAPSYADWVQKEPVEGAPALNDTRVWLLYDEQALYVGVINYDDDPAHIARNMARRDASYAGRSDYFEVMIDPNRDGLTAYRFRVTAGGVQTDRYLYADDKEDAAWDAVYESPVTVDERGWIAEFRIPLSQIRYETADTAQTWGIQFGRRRATDNELTRFSFVSNLRPGRVSQFGRVSGIVLDRTPGRFQALPYVVTQAHTGPSTPGDPFFDGSEADARVGVDLSYGLGSAFTLDATINPDFGQVEADPAVVNLTAFETFFREARPFFVQDARVFDFNLGSGQNSLFYSRRIGRAPHGGDSGGATFEDVPSATSILGAAKVTGRTTGGLSLGGLVAVTQAESGEGYFADTDSYEAFAVEPRSTYGVVRAQQDFREGQSRVGGIFTAMRRALPEGGAFDHLPGSAYSVGVDFEHAWSDRKWALWGFFSGSHVRGDSLAITRLQRASNHYRQRPDLDWATYDPSATTMTGADWRLQFERRVGKWTGAVWAAEITSGFEVNDLGFNTSPERLDGGLRVGYQEVRPKGIFRTSKVDFSSYHNFSHEVLRDSWSLDSWDRAHTSGMARLGGTGEFMNFWTVNASVAYEPDVMSRTATRGGPRMRVPGSWNVSLGMGTDNRRLLSLQPKVSITRRKEGAGHAFSTSLGVTLQPSTRLLVTLQPSYGNSADADQYVTTSRALPYAPTYGSRYLFADLERSDFSMVSRVNMTFTPRMSLELFAQPLISAGDYVTYKQLAQPETFGFDAFEEGVAGEGGCSSGRTCVDASGRRLVDFDGDGVIDDDFPDRDFNLRSLRATAVFRWEYRPGSTIFVVWQRRQSERASIGDFDFGRDLDALVGAPSDNQFIVKVNWWLGL